MSARWRWLSALALAPVMVGLVSGRPPAATAQSPGPTTTAPNPLGKILNDLLSTTTTARPGPTPAKPGLPGVTGTTKPGATSTTTSTTKPLPPHVVPAEAQRIIDSVRRSGGSSTAPLLAALRRLQDFGLTLEEASIVGMGHFPVAGNASYRDDWLEPRFTPVFHLHQGNDIFAAYGTPVRAPFDGSLRYGEDPNGGMAAYVTVPDGTYYYMAHLSAYAKDLSSGAKVKQGRVVGYVGDTGNARGGPPHVHFEMHPHGGAAVDPKSTLDSWLADALAQVPALVASYMGSAPRVLTSAGAIRRFDTSRFAGPAQPAFGSLLWASSVSPTGSTFDLAEAQAARAADEFDWEGLSGVTETKTLDWRDAEAQARALLAPLTPPALLSLVGDPGS